MFCHKMNRPEFYDYVGPMPHLSTFISNNDDERKIESIEQFYNEKVAQNYTYNLCSELVRYCQDDVNVLLMG